MAANPIFPLYYNDIDRSTKTWTDEEFGAYVRLLMDQWDKGYLPKDYQRLTRIATSLDRTWPLLKEKFIEVDGVLKNKKLEEIRQQRLKHSQKQKDNIQKRYQTTYQKTTKNLPLENDIENENEDKLNSVEKNFSLPDVPGDEIHFPIDTVEIRNAWEKWKHYRFVTHGKTYPMFGEQAALKQLEGMTEKNMIAAIFKAIESNWLNLYPEKNGKSNSTNKKQQHDSDIAAGVAEHYRKEFVKRGIQGSGG